MRRRPSCCSTTWTRRRCAQAVARVAGRAVVEVSGGVRLERVRELAEAGVGRHLRRRAHHARAVDRPGPRPGGLTVLLVVDVGNTQTHIGLIDGGARGRRVAHRHGAAPHQRRDRRAAAGLLLAAGHARSRRSSTRSASPPWSRASRSSGTRCARSTSASPAFVVGPGRADRHAHQDAGTRPRSAPTASSTPSPPSRCTAGRASSPTTARPPPSTSSPPRATTSAAPSPPASRSRSRRSPRARPSSSRSSSSSPSTPSASRPPRRCSPAPSTGSPARSRASCTPSGPSWARSAR